MRPATWAVGMSQNEMTLPKNENEMTWPANENENESELILPQNENGMTSPKSCVSILHVQTRWKGN